MPSARRSAEQILAGAPARSFRGAVWRVHWQEIEATDAGLSLRSSGRYHRGLDLFPPGQTWPALYTSLAPEIAVWEMVRRSAARNLAYLRNNVLTELAVDLSRLIDLSDPGTVGLAWDDLTGPDYLLCQEIAALAAERQEGLLVPSAAMPGTNLVIFVRNLPDPLPIRVVRQTALPLESTPA